MEELSKRELTEKEAGIRYLKENGWEKLRRDGEIEPFWWHPVYTDKYQLYMTFDEALAYQRAIDSYKKAGVIKK